MIDPDSPDPDRPTLKETEHYLVVNIQDSRVATGNILAGKNTKLGTLPTIRIILVDSPGKLGQII